MQEDQLTLKRKKLLFRAWHRGTREADILLGRYAEAHLPQMNEAQVDQLAALMDEQDPDIYDWLIGVRPVPPEFAEYIIASLREFYLQAETSEKNQPTDNTSQK
jgi:antitoxin CptB